MAKEIKSQMPQARKAVLRTLGAETSMRLVTPIVVHTAETTRAFAEAFSAQDPEDMYGTFTRAM